MVAVFVQSLSHVSSKMENQGSLTTWEPESWCPKTGDGQPNSSRERPHPSYAFLLWFSLFGLKESELMGSGWAYARRFLQVFQVITILNFKVSSTGLRSFMFFLITQFKRVCITSTIKELHSLQLIWIFWNFSINANCFKNVIALYAREKLKNFKSQKYLAFKLFCGHWYILFILQITWNHKWQVM